MIIFIIYYFAMAISIEDHFSNFGVPKLLHEYVIIINLLFYLLLLV